MEKLSREEVLHVAELGKIELSENEIEMYSYQLKALLDEINKFYEIDLEGKEEMITPSNQVCEVFSDEVKDSDDTDFFISNAPVSYDKFVEVRGVFNE